MKHGTVTGYTKHKCRCEECRAAWSTYHRAYRDRGGGREDGSFTADSWRDAFGALLQELCPDGLTDDCPVRRARAAAAG